MTETTHLWEPTRPAAAADRYRQYLERSRWLLRLMRDLATSDRQRQYWADQLAPVDAKIAALDQKAVRDLPHAA